MRNMIPNRKEKGFTLIELVMVIVILGILAAFALPRFADFGGDARSASRDGILGAMRSASSIAHAACLASDSCNASAAAATVTIEGETVDIIYGYPSAHPVNTGNLGIGGMAQVDGVNNVTSSGETYTATIADDCTVTYAEAAGANTPPVFDGTETCS